MPVILSVPPGGQNNGYEARTEMTDAIPAGEGSRRSTSTGITVRDQCCDCACYDTQAESACLADPRVHPGLVLGQAACPSRAAQQTPLTQLELKDLD